MMSKKKLQEASPKVYKRVAFGEFGQGTYNYRKSREFVDWSAIQFLSIFGGCYYSRVRNRCRAGNKLKVS